MLIKRDDVEIDATVNVTPIKKWEGIGKLVWEPQMPSASNDTPMPLLP